jgi:cardiolipin synthase A/B
MEGQGLLTSSFTWWEIFSFLYLLIQIVGFFLAMEAIIKSKTPQGALAWAVGLVAFPVLTIPFYMAFGKRKFYGYLEARRKGDWEILPKIKNFLNFIRSEKVEHPNDPYHLNIVEKLSGLPMTKGNRCQILIDGEETFREIFASIEEANDYVLIQFFIVRADRLGLELSDLLVKKSREGVRVLFVYDEIGCYDTGPYYWENLRAGGVEVYAFHSVSKRAPRWQINFRNHRKIVVVDGREGFFGGHNVGVEYLGEKPPLAPWRDTHIKVEGPIVQCLQIPFLEDWYWANEECRPHQLPKLNWKFETYNDDVRALLLPSGPNDRADQGGLFFTHLFNQAQERLWVASPYFVPDGKLVASLKLAAMKGVDTRLLLPDRPDHLMVYYARYVHLQDLQESGVKIYLFKNGFLHQKAFLIDQDLSCIGTANLDNRSLHLNFELMGLFDNRDMNERMEKVLLKDFENSQMMESFELGKESWLFQLKVKVSRLFSPIL